MKRQVKTAAGKTEYTLVYTVSKSRVSLKVTPAGEIRLCVPNGFSLREADEIVKKEMPGITAAREKFRSAARNRAGTLLLRGQRLEIKTGAVPDIRAENGVLLVPPGTETEDIRRYLAALVLSDIRVSLNKWGPGIGRPYGRVTVREQKTRWGSCSSKGNLNFNWKLIMAPPEALDYVVIHELCHLLYFNHSDRFWGEVEKRMPDYKQWKKWLKDNTNALIL